MFWTDHVATCFDSFTPFKNLCTVTKAARVCLKGQTRQQRKKLSRRCPADWDDCENLRTFSSARVQWSNRECGFGSCSVSALPFLAFLEQLASWQRFLRMHFCFLVLIWVIEAVLRLDMRQCGHNASSSLNPGWRVWERLWIGPVWNTRSELVLLAFAKGWSVWCWEFLRV